MLLYSLCFLQAEYGIRYWSVTGVQTCALLFSSRRRHTRLVSDWSSDVCSSDLQQKTAYELVSGCRLEACSSVGMNRRRMKSSRCHSFDRVFSSGCICMTCRSSLMDMFKVRSLS